MKKQVVKALELLNEPEIMQRIKEIARQSSLSSMDGNGLQETINSLHSEIKFLKEALRKKENELESLKSVISEKNSQLSGIQSELALFKEKEQNRQFTLQSLKEKNKTLEHQFSRFRDIYEQWHRISESLRKQVSNIIKANSFELFIVSSVQYDSLIGLWDFIQGEIQSDRLSKLEADLFIRIIEEGMAAYNMIYEQPVFQVSSAKTGSTFDDDTMIRARGSKPAGIVGEVLMPGIRNSKTGKWIRKSIVTIGGDVK